MELLLIRDQVRIGLRKRIQRKIIINNRICLGFALSGIIFAVLAVTLNSLLHIFRVNSIFGVIQKQGKIGIRRLG